MSLTHFPLSSSLLTLALLILGKPMVIRAILPLKEVGFLKTIRSIFIKEKIIALGLTDVDLYGKADLTHVVYSTLNNVATSRKSYYHKSRLNPKAQGRRL